jgi:hypothetical protein
MANELGKSTGMSDAGRLGVGKAIGGTLGTVGGFIVGGPLGAAAGGAAGAGLGYALDQAGGPDKSRMQLENEKRLLELQRLEKLNMLGLTEAEKQSLYTAGTGQIAGQLQQSRAAASAAGAAGMATGAGQDILRGGLAGAQGASLTAGVAREVQMQNLARKRELEGEMVELNASISEAEETAKAQQKQGFQETTGEILKGAGDEQQRAMAGLQSQYKMSDADIAEIGKIYGTSSYDELQKYFSLGADKRQNSITSTVTTVPLGK